MKSVSGAQLAKVLKKHGWKLLRVKGSHHVYGKSEKNRADFDPHP